MGSNLEGDGLNRSLKDSILPDSRLKNPKNVTLFKGLNWQPIFCANCGADGGMVPEEHCNFAFYLCQPCSERWTPLANTLMVPDEVFWQKVNEEQMSTYGRLLEASELTEILKDDTHRLTRLCKDRTNYKGAS